MFKVYNINMLSITFPFGMGLALVDEMPICAQWKPAAVGLEATLMQMAFLRGSFLEHAIFKDGFGVESVPNAKLLALPAIAVCRM